MTVLRRQPVHSTGASGTGEPSLGLTDQNDVVRSPDSLRTPAPTDWDHTVTLLRRSLKNDKREPKMWFARTLGICVLLMLYTIGFFINYQTEQSSGAEEGGYILHPGLPWTSDIRILLSSSVPFQYLLPTIAENLSASILQLQVDNETNATSFKSRCESRFGETEEWLGVFVDSESSYGIFFGGAESVPPYSSHLISAQRAIDVALLNVSGTDTNVVNQVQRVPEKISDEGGPTSDMPPFGPWLLVIGSLLVVSSMITSMFLLAPILRDKFEEVARAFVLVGVKLRVYLLSVLLYLSLMGVVTAGGLTGVSIGWRLFPLSNPGLIFVSHYLGLVGLYALFIFLSQLVNNLEFAQNMPWLVGFVSVGVASPFVVLDLPKWPLHLLTVISPFAGMVNYCARYVGNDIFTRGSGIHPGVNVVSSGLLACTLAQFTCLTLWVTAILVYSSQSVRRRFMAKRLVIQEEILSYPFGENFEPLAPGAELLLSMRDVCLSFTKGCWKRVVSADVLRGLDLDICSGEVFGFLGHNGAGKTTTIRCATGELGINAGKVTYYLKEGARSFERGEDVNSVQKRIGVCPQKNVVIRNMTCRETLTLFASLKGQVMRFQGQSKADAIAAEVDRWLSELRFSDSGDADKPVQTFSGGMKRKMSIAISLLGNPEVVFLDEPTAGCDPYSRRQVWDIILGAKKGRGIVLTTHFMDEADVLSDRVGIIKDGRLMACGSSLFLKHTFGIGYSLRYSLEAPELFCLPEFVPSATVIQTNNPGTHHWDLPYGTESSFSGILTALCDSGATNVTLELTTLEQVYLKTAKDTNEISDDMLEDGEDTDSSDLRSSPNGSDVRIDVGERPPEAELLRKIWDPSIEKKQPTLWEKFDIVQRFCMGNALKMKGAISLNIVMPLIYLIVCLVIVEVVGVSKDDRIVPEDIPIGVALLKQTGQFFGVPPLSNRSSVPLLLSADEPVTLEDYFLNDSLPFAGGYWVKNSTLQYNESFSPFALQVGEQLLANDSLWGKDVGMETRLVPLPYSPANFRIDILLVPIALSYGFLGMVFTVLDMLILKSNNIFCLFRVAGITEWSADLGIVFYKLYTTFLPFFALVLALGLGLQSVIWGDGGRWLATVLILLGYAVSVTPLGLLVAKLFLSDFESVKNWFPGVYMTFMIMPFMAWAMLLQFVPGARHVLLIVGDILCILPPFAFQRGIGQVIELSTEFNDPELTWAETWSWDSRAYFTILMMFAVGSLQWWYLHRLTSLRPARTRICADQNAMARPLDISSDSDLNAERERSYRDDGGINARDLVKIFVAKTKEGIRKKKSFKTAVHGVSFGIRTNEIYALLGPNGAGKTTTIKMLSGELTPEHGEVALLGQCASDGDKKIDHLFAKANVSFCPQFDSLFPAKTVMEHLQFYSKVRGCSWKDSSLQQHIEAIVRLLGLEDEVNKSSQDLSEGYKRRLSLAVALIGCPDAMLLDEPTTGMSPEARHRVWNVLRPRGSALSCGISVPATLLSTHYMDEASEIGSRIGIMIDGALVVSGNLNWLKEKFCNSYFVEIALQHDAPDTAHNAVLAALEYEQMEPCLFESLPYRFKLQVPFHEAGHSERTRQLARIFAVLEDNKEAFSIKFYSVQQMSLEQIFIDLCRKQFEAEETERAV